MLRYNLAANDDLRVEQLRRRPCVYLDHWALRDFSTTPELGARLSAAIEKHDGTLALSLMSWAEFAGITDAGQAAAAERLVEVLLPRLFFLRFEPFEVLKREENFDSGCTRQAPEGDEEALVTVARLRGVGVSGWTAKGIFTQPSERRDHLMPTIEAMADQGIEGVRLLRTRVDTLKEVQQAKRRRLKGLAGMRRATRPLLWEIITELEANRAGEPTRQDMIDLFHVVVPCAYCDFVLIDRRWHLAVDRARARMSNEGIAVHVARVFSKPDNVIEQFLAALEGFSSPTRAKPART
jgi:hypothetical protein